MTGWRNIVWALAAVVTLASPAFAQGGGASSTGSISGEVKDAQGGVLPGVTVTATSPAQIGQLTAVTNEAGIYRFPAVPPGEYRLAYELVRIPVERPRRHPHHAGLQRAGQRHAQRRHAAGNGDGERPVAGDRHERDAHPDQLRPADAVVDSERARHVVAARDHAVGDAEPRRRRRQHRRHADDVLLVRLLGTEPPADRRHQHHRRHGGRGLLSRLRLLRGGVHRRRRQFGGDAEPGRADAVCRQERRQPSVRQPLLRLREWRHPGPQPRSRAVPRARRAGERTHHPSRRQSPRQLQEPQHRRRRTDRARSDVGPLLVLEPAELGGGAAGRRHPGRHAIRHQAVQLHRQGAPTR